MHTQLGFRIYLKNQHLYHYEMTFLSLVMFFALNYTLSEVNIDIHYSCIGSNVTLSVLILLLFNLFESSYLKYVSRNNYLVQSSFSHGKPCFLMGTWRPYVHCDHRAWLIICVPSVYLSWFSVSHSPAFLQIHPVPSGLHYILTLVLYL